MNLDALEDLIRIVNDLNVKVDLNLRNPYNGNRYGYKLSALKEENIQVVVLLNKEENN